MSPSFTLPALLSTRYPMGTSLPPLPFLPHQDGHHKAVLRSMVGASLPNGANEEDAGYMRMAVQLARKAIGHTSPNPMVGCVIVKNGQVIGQGFHPKAGEPHAEVFALREAGEKAKGATAYVSLEPCNHTGRTPPCSQALVRAKVKRVVVGTVDPNPVVGGKGVQTLQKAGIEVVVGVEEVLCQVTAETFFHRITAKRPFVTLRSSFFTFLTDVYKTRSLGSNDGSDSLVQHM